VEANEKLGNVERAKGEARDREGGESQLTSTKERGKRREKKKTEYITRAGAKIGGTKRSRKPKKGGDKAKEQKRSKRRARHLSVASRKIKKKHGKEN